MTLLISSPAFNEGEEIPSRYTCEGQDISPQIDWYNIPKDARSLILIVDDPDAPAGVFTHWVIFNIPPEGKGLSEAFPSTPNLTDGSCQGKNDFGKTGYGGPRPPPSKPYRYRFTLHAIEKRLDLVAGSTKNQVLNASQGHVLPEGQLIGTYKR